MTTEQRAFLRPSLAALVLVATAGVPAAAPFDPEQGHVIDVRVPDSSATQRLTLRDGSQILGRVESIAGNTIVFRFSIGGGTPLFFGFDSERPFWFTPKLQVLATDRAQAAVGVIHVTGFDENAGIAYGVATFGSSDQALTAGTRLRI